MEKIYYSIFKPAGNETALVYGLSYSKEKKKIINNAIMKLHSNVEQVGFIDNNIEPELQMAGGEFCGNATRCAAYVFLNGQKGTSKIKVNLNSIIEAGVDNEENAWCEIPLVKEINPIIYKDSEVNIVKLDGIIIVVIKPNEAQKYLKNKKDLKKIGKNFISKYKLENNEAVGIMFCEEINKNLKINPIVWVKSIDTLFYETACGSGTTAVCIVETLEKVASQTLKIIQPSGLTITSKTYYNNERIEKAIISGKIETDRKKYCIEI